MKTELCSFSGFKIYPGHGQLFVRADSKAFRFCNSKSAAFFRKKVNPRKTPWTTLYRRMHKKGITEESSRRRARRTVKTQRSIVGASLDVIRAKRNQTEEVRQKVREEAIKLAKEKRLEQQKTKKQLEKTKTSTTTSSTTAPVTKAPPKKIISKQQQKGAISKVQAKSR
ncbi:60S ribosomal protein L24 [Coelomomyces lativittatus]|nr:60S ribosomal protein L24 [Coelomomyces lativittatus]